MNLSTLFRTKENLNLDKSTLTILRYIAIFGQFIAVNLVFFYLDLKFPIKESYIIIFIGLLTNLFLQFKVKVNQLKDTYASLFLLYDLFQLSSLLYLTGGILNPFSILMIIPTIVSSTFLSMGTTIILGLITSFLLLGMMFIILQYFNIFFGFFPKTLYEILANNFLIFEECKIEYTEYIVFINPDGTKYVGKI